MSETKGNKITEKVRIPEELMRELRRRKAAAELRGDKPPDFGDLLYQAWQKADAAPGGTVESMPGIFDRLTDDDIWLLYQVAGILRDRPQGDIFALLDTTLQKAARAYAADPHTAANLPKKGETHQGLTALPRGSDIPISETDLTWIELLQKIRHSRKPGLPTAVENNLQEFAWADDAWTELEKNQSALVSPTAAGPGGPRTAPTQLAPLAAAGGDQGRSGRSETGVDQKLAALEAADAESAEREKRAPRKARARR